MSVCCLTLSSYLVFLGFTVDIVFPFLRFQPNWSNQVEKWDKEHCWTSLRSLKKRRLHSCLQRWQPKNRKLWLKCKVHDFKPYFPIIIFCYFILFGPYLASLDGVFILKFIWLCYNYHIVVFELVLQISYSKFYWILQNGIKKIFIKLVW